MRYFIVFYEGEYGDARCIGNIAFSQKEHLNLIRTTEMIKEEVGLDECTITGFNELENHLDYEDWNYDNSIQLQ